MARPKASSIAWPWRQRHPSAPAGTRLDGGVARRRIHSHRALLVGTLLVAAFFLASSSIVGESRLGIGITWAAPARITVVTEDNGSTLLNPREAAVNSPGAEIACAVVRRAGFDCAIAVMPWARAYKTALETPNIMIAPMARTREREALFIWGGAELSAHQGLFALTQRHLAPIKSLEDVKRLRIGTIRGDFNDAYLRAQGLEDGDPGLAPANDLDTLVRKLELGRLDILPMPEVAPAIMCKSVAIYCQFVEVYPLEALKADLYFAFNAQSDPALVSAIMTAWRAMITDGSYNREFGDFPGAFKY